MKTAVSSDFAIDDIHRVSQESSLSNFTKIKMMEESDSFMLKAVKVLGTSLS